MTQALVTGATSGIGRAIALALRDAGHDVVAVGRDRDALAALGREGLTPLPLDLGDRAAVRQALRGLEPDVLV